MEWFKLQFPHLSVFSYKSMQTRIATKSHSLSVWGQILKQKDGLNFVMTHLGDRKDFNKTMWAKPFLNHFNFSTTNFWLSYAQGQEWEDNPKIETLKSYFRFWIFYVVRNRQRQKGNGHKQMQKYIQQSKWGFAFRERKRWGREAVPALPKLSFTVLVASQSPSPSN